MTKESPLNFFHTSAKKKLPETEAAQKASAPPAPPKVQSSPSISNPLIDSMIDRMNQMHREIDEKMEKLARAHGFTQEQLKQYLSNSQNFNKEQWDFLQKVNLELEKKVWAKVEPAIGAEIAHQKPTSPSSASSTSRKSRFVGTRRKWIPT